MSSAISRLGTWAASVMVALVGCNTDTRIEYQHDPTGRIETELSLTRPELAPFRVDGVVAAPLFRMITPQSTQVWIKLWSTSSKTVSVRSALLAGSGAQSAQRQSFATEQSTLTEKPASKGVQYGLILLGELSNEALASMAKDGQAQFSIELRVNPATEYQPLRFVITRHATKQWATH